MVKRHVSKLPIIVELTENVKDDKDNEVENIMFAMMTYDLYKLIVLVQVDDDVCDSMTKGVGSSYNSPDVNKQDRAKTSVEGEVDEEPGGNVSARSRSPRFRPNNA